MFKMIPLLILASVFAYSCSSSDTKKSEDKPAARSEEVSTEDAFADDREMRTLVTKILVMMTLIMSFQAANDESSASSGSEESFASMDSGGG